MSETGGPAFPCMPPQDTGAGSAVGYPYPEAGMTMRDYFAAKALGGWFASDNDRILKPVESLESLEVVRARLCRNFYAWADAMLAARNGDKGVNDVSD